MSNKSILTAYVSEIDQLLQSYDKKHPAQSLSQQKERKKYKRVYCLRDNTQQTQKTSTLWEDF